MNKISQYLYPIIFWSLRFITLYIFGIYFFAVLNAKYIWSEKFFTTLYIWSEKFFTTLINISFNVSYYIHKLFNSNNILSVVNTSFYAAPTKLFKLKYTLYSKFCANAQQADILLLSMLLILIILICIRFFMKKSIYFGLIAICVIYLLLYLFISSMHSVDVLNALLLFAILCFKSLNILALDKSSHNILFLPIMTLSIFLIAILINKCNKIKEIVKYIPIISELFCIDLIINQILNKTVNKKTIIFIILIESLIYSNMLYFVIPFKNYNFRYRIMSNRTYSIDFLKGKKILATSILYDNDSFFKKDNANFDYIQDIIVDSYKKKLYIYDHKKEKLLFLHIDDFEITEWLITY